ncbi:hypothetical protein Q9233_002006, partial [Columba guinea]
GGCQHAAPVGAGGTGSCWGGARGVVAVTDRCRFAVPRLRDRIRQQFQDCSAALQIDLTPCLDHIVDEELLQDAADDLERVMEELKLAFENKTLALQRMHLGFHLKNKVKRHDNDSRLIIGSMKHITMLSGTVIEYQQNIIIASRVNWVKDPSLKAIALQLENNVCSV